MFFFLVLPVMRCLISILYVVQKKETVFVLLPYY